MSALLERPRALNPGGVIPELVFRGGGLVGRVAEAVVGVPTLDLSTDEVSELRLKVSDPGFRLLESGLFAPGTAVDWLDLALEVAVLETGADNGIPTLDLAARSRGAQALKRARGPLVVRGVSPTTFAAGEAKRVGLGFLGEPSAIRPSIARAAPEPGAGDAESSWDVIQGLADELGFVAFEAAGRLHFGRPTWLMRQVAAGDAWVARFDPAGGSHRDTNPLDVVDVPACRRSVNADETTVGLSVVRTNGLKVRPGDLVKLRGVPTFDGDYLVTQVRIDLDALSPVELELAVPYDPPPQPPEPAYAEPTSSATGSGPAAPTSSGAGGTVSSTPVWPARGRITSRYGAPRSGGRRHGGLDIANSTGTRVVAALGGTVTFAGSAGGYGNLIKIAHGGGVETRYAHLSRFARTSGRVERGELVGYIGNTGASSGPHLHFEVRRGGSTIDPEGWLP